MADRDAGRQKGDAKISPSATDQSGRSGVVSATWRWQKLR
jgi:hypothetical protein